MFWNYFFTIWISLLLLPHFSFTFWNLRVEYVSKTRVFVLRTEPTKAKSHQKILFEFLFGKTFFKFGHDHGPHVHPHPSNIDSGRPFSLDPLWSIESGRLFLAFCLWFPFGFCWDSAFIKHVVLILVFLVNHFCRLFFQARFFNLIFNEFVDQFLEKSIWGKSIWKEKRKLFLGKTSLGKICWGKSKFQIVRNRNKSYLHGPRR